jgi:hypothetical protein
MSKTTIIPAEEFKYPSKEEFVKFSAEFPEIPLL